MTEIERPSPPLPSSRDCLDCGMVKDDTGETYGWGLCDCGSFRRNPPDAQPDQPAGEPND